MLGQCQILITITTTYVSKLHKYFTFKKICKVKIKLFNNHFFMILFIRTNSHNRILLGILLFTFMHIIREFQWISLLDILIRL